MLACVDWVEAIGFQRETVHAGALCYLLAGRDGAAVAQVLTGDGRIDAVIDPWPEIVLRDRGRRPVDLAADLRLRGERDRGVLAVEVKVDSAWKPEQLTDTVPRSCHGVLLAVGYTALAVNSRDMDALGGYTWPWNCVGPGEFATIVRDHADGDHELLGYADHLGREADDHSRAVDAARTGAPVDWGRHPMVLSHWAYFSEVVRLRKDAADWERKALISGALLTLWVVDADDGRSGFYLEFMGERTGRSLCAKTWAPSGDALLASRQQLLARVDGLGAQPVKLPRAGAKTCTAARFALDEVPPVDASRLVDNLVARMLN